MPAASQLQEAWLTRGATAWLLWPLSWLYRGLVALRHAGYRLGLLPTHRLPVPVIVVGNLIVGGAGKTPTTMALVQMLRAMGHRPGIVSRGYGRSSDEPRLVTRDTPADAAGDEPLLMHLRTGAPVAVGADRVAAGRLLLGAHPELSVLVSDDGLQHLRLARDAQVIVFDERGGGNGWLLPAGPLREPVPAEVPPRSLVVYNAARPSTPLPGHLAVRHLRGLTLLADWWAGRAATSDAFAALQGQSVVAAAGMARPQRYFEMLRAQGLRIDELPLPDHHPFTTLPWPASTADVVVTEKDAVKLRPERMGTTRVWVATLDFEIDAAIASQLLPWLTPTT
ncbi:tetraacyldisaccharide 4'-kinase [Piscinibacter gummiphilus]|uniref:Tetraacyldisaccharide 4'-kinase n=1 Tax=Piscinibacter gummiphilus TaxID=946333 RepID=A0ABZ0CMI2_9BURK|nr:tetraacyldisaccharide 4'-kinase [Piscinibacter gummiphilus]WOB06183.1 tetraacyldisaccharide 4'-kinase [Piscinibacter gummiphilus]